ncbi:hypothetical protein AVEN_103939-1 [Araneus ventricosus]|uniref:Uncharacterized protein n=1 Tax=Araneus ventricosus TaxID=182803 RepID=A0A4Y2I758_ARAVE|nr:hypothetical protein AVEN_103939-1 [Araneus ventricosus]
MSLHVQQGPNRDGKLPTRIDIIFFKAFVQGGSRVRTGVSATKSKYLPTTLLRDVAELYPINLWRLVISETTSAAEVVFTYVVESFVLIILVYNNLNINKSHCGIYRADGRANETAEETERRRSEDRLRIIARRNNVSAEETQQRHSDDRLRANARRNSMTTEERRSEDRLRRIARRNNITAEETEQRRSEDIVRKIRRRNNMTAEETQQ